MDHRSQTQVDAWLRGACADADRRALPALKPLLESLAQSTTALREADRIARDAEAAAAGTASGAPGAAAAVETTE